MCTSVSTLGAAQRKRRPERVSAAALGVGTGASGPVAASGGYWISSTADEIFAEPSTITGSIGVFGILPTFEDSLAGIGVTSDGVETTPLSTMDPFTGLNDSARQVFQTGTERTYERFTHLVARGRLRYY